MSNVKYITTDTDGLVKHTSVTEGTLKYFPSMLRFSVYDEDGLNDYLVEYNQEVPEHITAINGINSETLREFGKPHQEVAKTIHKVFAGEPTIVTNNAKFHRLVLESFMFRLGEELPDATWIDIQQEYKNICKLESKKLDYKLPKLKEVEEFLRHSNIRVPWGHQLDVIKAAYENMEELHARSKREDELAGF